MSRTRKSVRSLPSFRAKLTAVSVLVVLLCAYWVYSVKRAPVPPVIETDGVDPAVVSAIEDARQEVVAEPASASAWGRLAMALHAHDFTTEAAGCYSVAHQIDSADSRWMYLHAKCVSQSDRELAVSLLEHCVRTCGDNPDATRLLLVEMLLEGQDFDQAERHLNEFLKRHPLNARARHATARMHFMRGNYQACKNEILDLQNSIKRHYDAAKQKVRALKSQGNNEQAIDVLYRANRELRQSLCMQKSLGLLLASALRNLGETENFEKQRQLAMKQTDEAWHDPYAQQVLELRTGLNAMLTDADEAFRQQRIDDSISILTKTIAQYPDSLFARLLLGRACIRAGRVAHGKGNRELARQQLALADQHLRYVLTIDNASVEAQFRLGVSLVYLTDIDRNIARLSEAESWFRKAIAIRPDFTMAHYNLANCLDRQGRSEEAVHTMRQAVQCDPSHILSRIAIGALLLRAGELKEAEQNLRIAVQLDSENQTAHHLLERIGKIVTE